MSSVNLDPITVFDKSYPRNFQRRVVETLQELYENSATTTNSVVSTPHSKDLLPYVRRALIEQRLEELAAGDSGLKRRIETNKSGNSHVLIEGPFFTLTVCYANSPKKVVRWAAHRNAGSLENYPLFASNDPCDEPSEAMKFYAVLLHGHRRGYKRELGFAVVRFPNPGFKSYDPDLINLLARFPLVPSIIESDAMEDIPDAIDPKIITDHPNREAQ